MSPLELSYDLACSPDHAFEVWTRRLSTWWPKGHGVSHDPATVVSLEGHVGGRLMETTPAGEVIVFGEVTSWDPPRSFGYRWHIGREPSEFTDVRITFSAAESGCRLATVGEQPEDGSALRVAERLEGSAHSARMRLFLGACSTSARPRTSRTGGTYMPNRPR